VTLDRLPGWIVDNATSVRREVADQIGTSMIERWEATRRACRAARAILRFHARAESVLANPDPLPASSLRALERLRARKRAP